MCLSFARAQLAECFSMDTNRSTEMKKLVMVVAVLWAACALAEDLYLYEVFGKNTKDGQFVAGEMSETDKRGGVVARIWDKTEVFDGCTGGWTGKGLAEVVCKNGQTYEVEVIK